MNEKFPNNNEGDDRFSEGYEKNNRFNIDYGFKAHYNESSYEILEKVLNSEYKYWTKKTERVEKEELVEFSKDLTDIYEYLDKIGVFLPRKSIEELNIFKYSSEEKFLKDFMYVNNVNIMILKEGSMTDPLKGKWLAISSLLEAIAYHKVKIGDGINLSGSGYISSERKDGFKEIIDYFNEDEWLNAQVKYSVFDEAVNDYLTSEITGLEFNKIEDKALLNNILIDLYGDNENLKKDFIKQYFNGGEDWKRALSGFYGPSSLKILSELVSDNVLNTRKYFKMDENRFQRDLIREQNKLRREFFMTDNQLRRDEIIKELKIK